MSLTLSLCGVGRREEALAAAEEAVRLYGDLAQRSPDAFLPGFAGALNSLGNRLSEVGRREEALAAAEEAVRLHRQLTQRSSDAFLPELAQALNNFGIKLFELGRWEQALAAADEAAVAYYKLTEAYPNVFAVDLARALAVKRQALLAWDPEAAAKVFEAGIRMLSACLLAQPSSRAALMPALRGMYIDACEAAVREPDAELLTVTEEALAKVGTSKSGG